MSSISLKLPGHWKPFLKDIDRFLNQRTELVCIGGFALEAAYDLPRSTRDVDILEIRPKGAQDALIMNAGPDSELFQKHGLYLQSTSGVCELPLNHEPRLTEVAAGEFTYLHIFVPDLYDLALTKLQRNREKDRADFRYMIRAFPLEPAELKRRYDEELRPYLLNPGYHDITLDLWLEIAAENKSGRESDT